MANGEFNLQSMYNSKWDKRYIEKGDK